MATKANNSNNKASDKGLENSDQNRIVLDGDTVVEIADPQLIANAEILKDGQDLILRSENGEDVVIEGYFSAAEIPNITASDGSVLTPHIVQSFMKPANGVQFAETQNIMDISPIGEIQEISGDATIIRTDGTTEPISLGMAVFKGDIIETAEEGAVNITFSDESTFAVSRNARMAIDEYVFDPAAESGQVNFSVLRGLFVFVSGIVGRDDPDDINIDTPKGSIGIRGTTVLGDVDAGEITVIEGAVVMRAFDGTELTLSNRFETGHFNNFTGIENRGVTDVADLASRFELVRNVAGDAFNTMIVEGHADPQNDPQGPEGDLPDAADNKMMAQDENGPENRPDGPPSDDMDMKGPPPGEPQDLLKGQPEIPEMKAGEGNPAEDGPLPNEDKITLEDMIGKDSNMDDFDLKGEVDDIHDKADMPPPGDQGEEGFENPDIKMDFLEGPDEDLPDLNMEQPPEDPIPGQEPRRMMGKQGLRVEPDAMQDTQDDKIVDVKLRIDDEKFFELPIQEKGDLFNEIIPKSSNSLDTIQSKGAADVAGVGKEINQEYKDVLNDAGKFVDDLIKVEVIGLESPPDNVDRVPPPGIEGVIDFEVFKAFSGSDLPPPHAAIARVEVDVVGGASQDKVEFRLLNDFQDRFEIVSTGKATADIRMGDNTDFFNFDAKLDVSVTYGNDTLKAVFDPTGPGTPFPGGFPVVPDFQIGFVSGSQTVNEDDGTISVEVRLTILDDIPVEHDITAQIAKVGGTAGNGDIGNLSSAVVTFAPGSVDGDRQTVTIPLTNDTLAELDETILLQLSNPRFDTLAAGVISQANHTITVSSTGSGAEVLAQAITEFQVVNATANENGDLVLTVQRSHPNATGFEAPQSVDYNIQFNGGAEAADISTATTGTILFNPQSNTATVTISPVNDTIVEQAESFDITLLNPSFGSIGGQATATVTLDPAGPGAENPADIVVEFQTTTATLAENGTIDLVITRTHPNGTSFDAPQDVDVAINFNAGATAGDMQPLASGRASFAPNATTTTVTLTPVDDNAIELNETFQVVLSNPNVGALGSQTVNTVTLTSNEATSGIEVGFVAGSQTVNEDDGTISIDVRLNLPNGQTLGSDVTVDIADASTGTARNTDFANISASTITFASGSGNGATQTVTLDITNDTLVEINETIDLALSNVRFGGTPAGSITQSTHTVTISGSGSGAENAAATTTQLQVTSATIGESGTLDVVIERTNGGGTGFDLPQSVDYTITLNANASAADIDNPLTGTVLFDPGNATATLSIDITDDNRVEVAETFDITLSNPSVGSLGGQATQTVTIDGGAFAENPAQIVTEFQATSANVQENGDVVIVVQRSHPGGGIIDIAQTVDATLTFNSSASASDISSPTNVTVNFAAGEMTSEITISGASDTKIEPNETLDIVLSNPSIGSLGANTTNTLTVLSAATDIQLGFVSASQTVNEDAGTMSIDVSITLPVGQTLDRDLTVDITNEGSGTASGSDVSNLLGTITFSSGTGTGQTQTVTMDITDDNILEGDETFVMQLGNLRFDGVPISGTFTQPTHTVTISGANHGVGGDDPTALDVSFVSGSQVIDEASGTVSVDLVLTTPNGQPLGSEVTAAVSPTGGTADNGDYTLTSETVTFKVGSTDGTTQTVTFPITDDGVANPLTEFDETILLGISDIKILGQDLGSASASNVHTVTIAAGTNNNDTLVGNASNNKITALDGDDILVGGDGNDTLNGGNGTDTADYSSASGAVVIDLASNLAVNDGENNADKLISIENITGSNFGGQITGNGNANVLKGGAGIDTIVGGGGNDTINGGGGVDTVDYSSAAAGVTVNLNTGQATDDGDGGVDTLSNVENIIGSSSNDTLIGNSANNLIQGGSGVDIIDGGAGNDDLRGGGGNDTILGSLGSDSIQGNGGTDLVTYANLAEGTIRLNLSNSNATLSTDGSVDTFATVEDITLTNQNDLVIGSNGADDVNTGGGNDSINGSIGADRFDGGTGSDTINYSIVTGLTGIVTTLQGSSNTTVTKKGLADDDVIKNIENIIGSSAGDTITGDSENNTINGGSGNDTLAGGAGDDLLILENAGADKVDGGLGDDTLELRNSATYDFTALSGNFTGIEHINLGNSAQTLIISGLDLFNLSNESNTIKISGSSSDVVTLVVDNGEFSNQGDTNNDGYDELTDNAVTVLIDSDINVNVPVLNVSGLDSNIVFLENTVNASPQFLDSDLDITFLTDIAQGGFNGQGLIISTTGGPEDQLSIRNQGNGVGEISYDSGTGSVKYGGLEIGRVSATLNGSNGKDLRVNLNNLADEASIEGLLNNLTYANSSDTPIAERQLFMGLTEDPGSTGTITHVQTLSDGGIDGEGTSINGMSSANDVAVTSSNRYVYVTGSADNAVAAFEIQDDGELLFIEVLIKGGTDGNGTDLNGLGSAEHLVIDASNEFVYVTSSSDNTISVFEIQNDGTLYLVEEIVDGSPDGGANTVDGIQGVTEIILSPNGNFAYAIGAGENAITTFAVQGDGTLRFVETLTHNGTDADTNLLDSLDGANSVTIDPSGNFVYVTAETSDAITVFEVQGDGSLLLVQTIADGDGGSVDGLNGVKNIAFDPQGEYAYVTGGVDNSISIFSVAANGSLSHINTLTNGSVDGGGNSIGGLSGAIDVVISSNGNYAYVSSTDSDSINIFSIAADGSLLLLERIQEGSADGNNTIVSGINGIKGITTSASGSYLFAASENSSTVTTFKINKPTSIASTTITVTPEADFDNPFNGQETSQIASSTAELDTEDISLADTDIGTGQSTITVSLFSGDGSAPLTHGALFDAVQDVLNTYQTALQDHGLNISFEHVIGENYATSQADIRIGVGDTLLDDVVIDPTDFLGLAQGREDFDGDGLGADVFFSDSLLNIAAMAAEAGGTFDTGTLAKYVISQEIGHALGLPELSNEQLVDLGFDPETAHEETTSDETIEGLTNLDQLADYTFADNPGEALFALLAGEGISGPASEGAVGFEMPEGLSVDLNSATSELLIRALAEGYGQADIDLLNKAIDKGLLDQLTDEQQAIGIKLFSNGNDLSVQDVDHTPGIEDDIASPLSIDSVIETLSENKSKLGVHDIIKDSQSTNADASNNNEAEDDNITPNNIIGLESVSGNIDDLLIDNADASNSGL